MTIDSGDKDDEDDKALWAYVTRDVRPLSGREGKKSKKRRAAARDTRREGESLALLNSAKTPPRSRDMDRRTAERVRQGRMKIEGRLDLHGMGRQDAHRRLVSFVLDCYERELRCLLVITGKGVRGRKAAEDDWTAPVPGVLRREVPEWLDEPPLRDIVLSVCPAQRQHGGDGALYVLLRRKRGVT